MDLFQELPGVERFAKQWCGAVQAIDRIDVAGNHKRSFYQAPLFQGHDEFRTAHAGHLDISDQEINGIGFRNLNCLGPAFRSKAA